MKSVDKRLIKRRFEANFAGYDRLAVVQQRICDALAGYLRGLGRDDVGRALEIGAGTGFLTKSLLQIYPNADWWLNDISTEAERYISKHLSNATPTYLWGDAEAIEFPSELDLIASASTIQWFENIALFAQKAAAATSSGGLLAISTFGADNFIEIRATTGEGLHYPNTDELRAVFERSGYRIITLEEHLETLQFDTPLDVLRHIKATGVNSLRRTIWNRSRISRFDAEYRELFSSPSGVSLTYNPIILIAQLL